MEEPCPDAPRLGESWRRRVTAGGGGAPAIVRHAGDGCSYRALYCVPGDSFIYSRPAPIACDRGYSVASSRKEFLHNASLTATSPIIPGCRSALGIERGRFASPASADLPYNSLATCMRYPRAAAVAIDSSAARFAGALQAYAPRIAASGTAGAHSQEFVHTGWHTLARHVGDDGRRCVVREPCDDRLSAS